MLSLQIELHLEEKLNFKMCGSDIQLEKKHGSSKVSLSKSMLRRLLDLLGKVDQEKVQLLN